MSLTLTFHGAAECVTGSCMRLATKAGDFLVDCGMFQGSKSLKTLNYDRFPFDPRDIRGVLLTHAHIDHSGLLPKLVRAGFKGPIWATAATRDLCHILLADSAGIQEIEIEHLNRRNRRRGRPDLEPIYRPEDVERAMSLFHKVKLGEPVRLGEGVDAVWWEAGHILGSASIEVRTGEGADRTTVLFSGDLGPGGSDYAPDPQGPAGVDHVVMESTYGERRRETLDSEARRALLAAELNDAFAAGGPLLIPAFAVERSQELLADILTLVDRGEAPESDIFLDSPLAIEATRIFQSRGWNPDEGRNPFQDVRASDRLKFLEKPWDSDSLDRLSGWHIIMAGSGMCDAGRIRKHLERWLWNRACTVLLAGYQASGTLGRLLADGAKRVSIRGEEIRVAARIRTLDIYSGHADADGLANWIQARTPIRGGVILDHGEPEALSGLQQRLKTDTLPGADVRIARMDQSFTLAGSILTAGEESARPRRLSSDAPTRPDWHNDRARLIMRLQGALEHAGSDADRARILETVARSLTAATGGD